MTKELIEELQGIVTKLGGYKGDFTDKAMDNWCNGLVCLSAALYHEAHELSRKAHTFPRKVVKELVAACFLLMSVVPYAMQAATNETQHLCWVEQPGMTNVMWNEVVDGVTTGFVICGVRQGVTNKTWWVINYETNNIPTNAVSVIVDCP